MAVRAWGRRWWVAVGQREGYGGWLLGRGRRCRVVVRQEGHTRGLVAVRQGKDARWRLTGC